MPLKSIYAPGSASDGRMMKWTDGIGWDVCGVAPPPFSNNLTASTQSLYKCLVYRGKIFYIYLGGQEQIINVSEYDPSTESYRLVASTNVNNSSLSNFRFDYQFWSNSVEIDGVVYWLASGNSDFFSLVSFSFDGQEYRILDRSITEIEATDPQNAHDNSPSRYSDNPMAHAPRLIPWGTRLAMSPAGGYGRNSSTTYIWDDLSIIDIDTSRNGHVTKSTVVSITDDSRFVVDSGNVFHRLEDMKNQYLAADVHDGKLYCLNMVGEIITYDFDTLERVVELDICNGPATNPFRIWDGPFTTSQNSFRSSNRSVSVADTVRAQNYYQNHRLGSSITINGERYYCNSRNNTNGLFLIDSENNELTDIVQGTEFTGVWGFGGAQSFNYFERQIIVFFHNENMYMLDLPRELQNQTEQMKSTLMVWDLTNTPVYYDLGVLEYKQYRWVLDEDESKVHLFGSPFFGNDIDFPYHLILNLQDGTLLNTGKISSAGINPFARSIAPIDSAVLYDPGDITVSFSNVSVDFGGNTTSLTVSAFGSDGTVDIEIEHNIGDGWVVSTVTGNKDGMPASTRTFVHDWGESGDQIDNLVESEISYRVSIRSQLRS